MLMIWPLVAWVLYSRLPPDKALIWTILGGYMVLPTLVVFNLPVVPDLTKDSVPALAAAAIVVFRLRDRISVLPKSTIGKMLICLFVLSPFATVLTNGDAIYNAKAALPALRIYDSVATIATQGIALLPFFLARRYLATPEAMRTIVMALVAAGLAYSLPIMIESRLSPILNLTFYGYMQHDFFQTLRFGGYRPMVFMPHGLWVAFFVLMSVLATLTMVRNSPAPLRPRYLLAMVYMLGILVLCKSAGPTIYAIILAPVLLIAPQRWQLVLAACLAIIVITYPLLRGSHLIPVDSLLNMASQANAERASSLNFRLVNEEQLLAHAAERPWFGWGGYGRSLLYDIVTGERTSIVDGYWIITLGIYGWLGYIAEFGLLVLPLLLLGREAIARRKVSLSPFVGPVALILAANLVDLLPNATIIPFTWLLVGALLGYAETLKAERLNTNLKDWKSALKPTTPRTVI